SIETAKELYQELLNEYKVGLDQLFEIIGFLCASVFAKAYPKSSLTKDKGSILVCCGPGRNGAEGLVCARHLKLFGYRPTVFYPKPASEEINLSLTDQCERHGIPFLFYLPSEPQLIADSYNVIVDAIFGFNFEGRPPSSEFNHIIKTLGRSKLPIVSINLPSGYNNMTSSDSEPNETFIKPETLISMLVPLECARHYNFKNHFLVGHLLLPLDLVSKYFLYLPSFKDSTWSYFDMLYQASISSTSGCGSSGSSNRSHSVSASSFGQISSLVSNTNASDLECI
ncbi:hypothetical protein HELRODRAFT_73647, partial [Helobdella robusta]|uniref:NAD(P)H-hydrate epimerase n=1 Tax=Helobdella robusta TaxID=6412 RepID=T1G1G8_HELRO